MTRAIRRWRWGIDPAGGRQHDADGETASVAAATGLDRDTAMITDIILICRVPQFVRAVSDGLRRHNRDVTIHPVADRPALDGIGLDVLLNARIIGFTTDVIVPRWMLHAAGYGSYNFHPGPPDLPGWAPISFAVYEGARRFGVTAHVMEAKTDTGAIVGSRLFEVAENTGYAVLQGAMVKAIFELFHDLARPLATSIYPLPATDVAWSGEQRTRRMAEELCEVSLAVPHEELARLIEAFGPAGNVPRPAISFRGFRFVLTP